MDLHHGRDVVLRTCEFRRAWLGADEEDGALEIMLHGLLGRTWSSKLTALLSYSERSRSHRVLLLLGAQGECVNNDDKNPIQEEEGHI